MCNACGFGCCAWDGFGKCGCECEVIECWDDDMLEREFGLGDDDEDEPPEGE